MAVFCIRLRDKTAETLRQMADVDGKAVEKRLAEVIEELVAIALKREETR